MKNISSTKTIILTFINMTYTGYDFSLTLSFFLTLAVPTKHILQHQKDSHTKSILQIAVSLYKVHTTRIKLLNNKTQLHKLQCILELFTLYEPG